MGTSNIADEVTYPFVDALYRELLERGVRYFLPMSQLEVLEPIHPRRAELICNRQ